MIKITLEEAMRAVDYWRKLGHPRRVNMLRQVREVPAIGAFTDAADILDDKPMYEEITVEFERRAINYWVPVPLPVILNEIDGPLSPVMARLKGWA